MRLRWLVLFSLTFFGCATSAFANKRSDLPTSGGGVLNDCGSPRDQAGLFFSESPVVSLTPIAVKDSSGNTYTAHVDVYDWGNLACLYPDQGYSSNDSNEIRTSGTHSLFVVYVEGPNGTTVAQSALHSIEIARPLTHPDFNICERGWTYCNTSTPGPDLESENTPLLEPAASPGADGSSTVWSFGPGFDVSKASPIPLNSNVDTMNEFGGVGYGYAVLIADGTVTCDNPVDGPCNSISASTPYTLSFTPPGDNTSLTASSIAAKTYTSAAGHDSSTNPIVITGGAFQGLYNVSGNYPTLLNGVPANSNGSNASNVTFNCATVSTSLQQFRSVYFKWVAPTSTNVTVSTAGSHYDTVLMVAALTGASFQTCNDDNDPTSANYPNGIGIVTSALTFTATAGTTYQFLVTEYPQTQMTIEAVDDSFNETDDTYIGPLSGDSSLYFTLSAAPVNVTTTASSKAYVPEFTGGPTMANSVIQQYNGGIGIGRTPAATLDVNGKSIFRGGMDMSRVGDATPTVGATSSPLQMQSSVYNSSTKSNLLPYFQTETEPVGNNTASTGASLNFLYYSGIGCCAAETGLSVNGNGTLNFVAAQTFPGTKPAVIKTTLSTALQGEPGPPGPAGPTGPAGVVGPDIAVSGTVAASRGFLSESNDASTAAFTASNSADNAAVMSLSSSGKGSYGMMTRSAYVGLYAQGTSYAARFNGALATDSNLTSTASSYRIDDPLHPEDATLSHSTVSSAQRMNLYNGIAITDSNGIAVVAMPKYVQALNRDFQYQLTVIGQFSRAIVATRIANGAFTIRTEKPNVKVSWQVTGVRQDAWANAHPIAVEAAKPNAGDGPIIRPGPIAPATGPATGEPTRLQPAPR